jgi:hypothetical protein
MSTFANALDALLTGLQESKAAFSPDRERQLAATASVVAVAFGSDEANRDCATGQLFAALAAGVAARLGRIVEGDGVGAGDADASAACVVQLLRVVGNACFYHSVNRMLLVTHSDWCRLAVQCMTDLTAPERLARGCAREVDVLGMLLGAFSNVLNEEPAVFTHVWALSAPTTPAPSSNPPAESVGGFIFTPLLQLSAFAKTSTHTFSHTHPLAVVFARMLAFALRLVDIPQMEEKQRIGVAERVLCGLEDAQGSSEPPFAVLRALMEWRGTHLTSPASMAQVNVLLTALELSAPRSDKKEANTSPAYVAARCMWSACAPGLGLGGALCGWLGALRVRREDPSLCGEHSEHWLANLEEVAALLPRVTECLVRVVYISLSAEVYSAQLEKTHTPLEGQSLAASGDLVYAMLEAGSTCAAQFVCSAVQEKKGNVAFDMYDLSLASRLMGLLTQVCVCMCVCV